jgi:arginase
MSKPWVMMGVPIDCVGFKPEGPPRGTELSPAYLRQAGIVEELYVDDYGDLSVRINRTGRDPETGILGFDSVCAMTRVVRENVAQLIGWGVRPLLVGGCCSFLPGAVAGASDSLLRRIGLAYVDGHSDLYTGKTSPTGEFADMPIAAMLGYAPAKLLGADPVLCPENLALLGYRDLAQAKADGSMLPSDLDDEPLDYPLERLRQQGSGSVGAEVAHHLQVFTGYIWAHFDVDVLNPNTFPATDYLMPDGLSWDELVQLLRPIVHNPALIGVSIACYNPEKDLDGHCARDIVANLARVFAPESR